MTTRLAHAALVALLTLAFAAACGGDDDGDPTPTDAGPEDGGPPPEPTLAPLVDPTPVAIDAWQVTFLRPGADDPLLRQALDDTLRPGDGWEPVVPGENGALTETANVVAYAMANVQLAEGERLFARVDGRADVFLRGVRQPGDPYRSRTHRVPLGGRAGDNWVIVRALDGRDVEVELFRTTDELVFNLADLTVPDLAPDALAPGQWVGVPVLHLGAAPVPGLRASVVENAFFHGDAPDTLAPGVGDDALPPAGMTQLAFPVLPRDGALPAPGERVPLTLRVSAPGLAHFYERTIELDVVEAAATRRLTYRALVDGSVQYYAVVPPTGAAPEDGHGLVLSLHGAGVQAIGQARAYSAKDWAYLVAATNRRPFGFDWEAWGRLDALEVLANASALFSTDPARTHVTGHSMGGHGTWQLGVLFPQQWGVVGPSAGWASFETYGGTPFPDGAFGRARASSDTLDFTDNLTGKSVYVIHGDADTNVPVREARDMVARLEGVADPLTYHEQPGAGHWWDADGDEPGADCVDWEPMFEVMRDTRRAVAPLDFTIELPAPGIGGPYGDGVGILEVRSVETPYANARVTSSVDGDTVTVATENVRTLEVSTEALRDAGIRRVVVDGEARDVPDREGGLRPEVFGPTQGKQRHQRGPFFQAFEQPFCFVYPDAGEPGADVYRSYATWLLSQWSILGNGHGCAVPASRADALTSTGPGPNRIWLGVTPPAGEGPDGFGWDAGGVTVGDRTFTGGDGVFFLAVYPRGNGVSAVMAATPGYEDRLFLIMPFSSRAGLPDWLVYRDGATAAVGFFDPDWQLDPALAEGL